MPEPPIPIHQLPIELEAVEDTGVGLPDSQPEYPVVEAENLDSTMAWAQTESDAFDLYRQYHGSFPTYDPKNSAYFDQFCDSATFTPVDGPTNQPWYGRLSSTIETVRCNYFTPFLNAMTFRLMSWFYNSSQSKSLGDLDRLVNDVILADDFDPGDLHNFSATRESKRMDRALNNADSDSPYFSSADGWQETSVEITLPCEKVKFHSEADAPKFSIDGLHYRKFTEVIKSAYEEVAAQTFHSAPFKLFWQPNEDKPPERIITELYTADAVLQEHKKIKAAPHEPGYYPEKVLLACIKFLGRCPCPRCLVDKDKIDRLGDKHNRWQRTYKSRADDRQRKNWIEIIREKIFVFGHSVVSAAVEKLLGTKSLVPTRNAFSEKLARFGFDFHSMLVPDFMHKFELGVWKATLTHLLRILYASSTEAIQELNKCYCLTPTFGRDTIRKFSANVSGLTKLAVRDFEDLLQCALPAFKCLLPEPFNTIILDLLFELATWHAFGKLRMHTETTLNDFDKSTTRLGKVLRKFRKDVCDHFETRDLPRESAARARRQSTRARKGKQKQGNKSDQEGNSKHRLFNMSTYKLHALGDYVKSIWLFGTTDNYSMQVGELEHRQVKRFYA
ncbi:hypothetical protein PAXRUDRAFT_16092 [Paxillus rubicundulus Ve08.2h10]|uniref:Transposase domain-containing protein n=1 Tax=Paxillus rubicundulus Ve08.2h10 TaxID=930991 RepID=A0A0D0CWG6_9AGAM|nr:hypothetical protein PAXRUDRAFT_16092 [Paxillus rubicundulus Ve08.2h10]